jgi:nucleotide-binding universal stress UspA family protein
MPDSRAILDDAVVRAATSWPDVVVTSQSLPGPVADAFIEASIEADTVVVGAPDRRQRGFRDFGSTAWQVAIHALCPVVIVPKNPDPADHGVVVVGVDGSPGSHRAVEYAFRRAGESAAELVAVYGWHTAPVRSLTDGPEQARLHADELSTWLASARARHPDVGVRPLAVRADPVATILQESRHARLVVVGSRGREGVQGLVLGSVGMGLLRESTSPVAIVRT